MKKFRLEAKGDTAEMWIYDQIGESFWSDGVTAKDVSEHLQGLSSSVGQINCHINSPGGDVFDGVTIYNILVQHKAKVNMMIDGVAASAASVIAMAGDTINVAENGTMMIHDPWSGCVGNATDLRKMADDLDKIRDVIALTYQRRTAQDLTKIKTMMADETWMTGQECVDKGFATGIMPAKTAQNSFDARILATYRHVPERVKNAATGFEDFPLSDRGHAWDATAADRRWRSHCSSDGSGTKEKMDWARYRNGHFWYDPANTESFGGYKLPFVDVLGGKPTAVWRGVTAVAQRLDATDIPTQDKDDVRHNVERYYEKAAKQYGDDSITAPWKNAFHESAYLRDRLALLIG